MDISSKTSRRLQPILPLLRILVLNNVRFEPHSADDPSQDPNQLADTLCKVFSARANSGCSVEHLVIEGCSSVRRSDVGLLREVVKEVVWDV